MVLNSFVEKAVICEESGIGISDCLVVLRIGQVYGDERVPSRATCCVLLVKKDCIQLRVLLRTP